MVAVGEWAVRAAIHEACGANRDELCVGQLDAAAEGHAGVVVELLVGAVAVPGACADPHREVARDDAGAAVDLGADAAVERKSRRLEACAEGDAGGEEGGGREGVGLGVTGGLGEEAGPELTSAEYEGRGGRVAEPAVAHAGIERGSGRGAARLDVGRALDAQPGRKACGVGGIEDEPGVAEREAVVAADEVVALVICDAVEAGAQQAMELKVPGRIRCALFCAGRSNREDGEGEQRRGECGDSHGGLLRGVSAVADRGWLFAFWTMAGAAASAIATEATRSASPLALRDRTHSAVANLW